MFIQIKKGKIYPNGRIKKYNNKETFVFDFVVKYVDKNKKETHKL